MRKTILTAAVIGLALSAGTGLASAQDAAPGATGGESAPGATVRNFMRIGNDAVA